MCQLDELFPACEQEPGDPEHEAEENEEVFEGLQQGLERSKERDAFGCDAQKKRPPGFAASGSDFHELHFVQRYFATCMIYRLQFAYLHIYTAHRGPRAQVRAREFTSDLVAGLAGAAGKRLTEFGHSRTTACAGGRDDDGVLSQNAASNAAAVRDNE